MHQHRGLDNESQSHINDSRTMRVDCSVTVSPWKPNGKNMKELTGKEAMLRHAHFMTLTSCILQAERLPSSSHMPPKGKAFPWHLL